MVALKDYMITGNSTLTGFDDHFDRLAVSLQGISQDVILNTISQYMRERVDCLSQDNILLAIMQHNARVSGGDTGISYGNTGSKLERTVRTTRKLPESNAARQGSKRASRTALHFDDPNEELPFVLGLAREDWTASISWEEQKINAGPAALLMKGKEKAQERLDDIKDWFSKALLRKVTTNQNTAQNIIGIRSLSQALAAAITVAVRAPNTGSTYGTIGMTTSWTDDDSNVHYPWAPTLIHHASGAGGTQWSTTAAYDLFRMGHLRAGLASGDGKSIDVALFHVDMFSELLKGVSLAGRVNAPGGLLNSFGFTAAVDVDGVSCTYANELSLEGTGSAYWKGLGFKGSALKLKCWTNSLVEDLSSFDHDTMDYRWSWHFLGQLDMTSPRNFVFWERYTES